MSQNFFYILENSYYEFFFLYPRRLLLRPRKLLLWIFFLYPLKLLLWFLNISKGVSLKIFFSKFSEFLIRGFQFF